MDKRTKEIVEKITSYLKKEYNTDKIRLFSLPLPIHLYKDKDKERINPDLTEKIRDRKELTYGVLSYHTFRFPTELSTIETSILGFPVKAVVSPYGKVERIYVSCASLYYLMSGRGLRTMPSELISLYVEVEKPGLAVFVLLPSYYFELKSIRVVFPDGKCVNFANTFSVAYYHDDILKKVRDAISFEFILNLVEFLRTNQVVYPYVLGFFNNPVDLEPILSEKWNKSTSQRVSNSYYSDSKKVDGFLIGDTDNQSLMKKVNEVYQERFKIFPHQGSNTVQAVENYIMLLKLIGL